MPLLLRAMAAARPLKPEPMIATGITACPSTEALGFTRNLFLTNVYVVY
jgi:hypothetical protein